jgi:hypothetical protein
MSDACRRDGSAALFLDWTCAAMPARTNTCLGEHGLQLCDRPKFKVFQISAAVCHDEHLWTGHASCNAVIE